MHFVKQIQVFFHQLIHLTFYLSNIGDEHADSSKGRKQIQIIKHLSKYHSKVPLFIEKERKLKELHKSEKERRHDDIRPNVYPYLDEGYYYNDLRCEVHKLAIIVGYETLQHGTDQLIVKNPF